MAILVTGGCGLVGSFIVRELVKSGEQPVVYDLVLKTDLFQDILPAVSLVKGDILDLPDLLRTIQEYRVEIVLHTASFLTPGAWARPYAGVKTNVIGAMNVYEAARLSNVRRVVFTSTGKTHLVARQYAATIDSGELGIEPDPYTNTKVVCELLANDYRRMYGLDIRIARFGGQIYGPGYGFGGSLGQAFEELLPKALRGEPVRLERAKVAGTPVPLEQEDAPVSLLYARDAAHGAILVGSTKETVSSVFNIAAPQAATLREIAEVVQELIPGARIETPPSSRAGGPIEVDPHARDELGYQPQYTLREGLKEYISFLRTGDLIYG